MEKETSVLVKVPYYHLEYDDPRLEAGLGFFNQFYAIELTGRYRYVKTSPKNYHIDVEYFYTPKGAKWEEIDNDGVQIRSIKRGWIKDSHLKIEHLVYYKPEVSEIQECSNGFC